MVSPRSGLPTPFLVGIFSAIALGIAWWLVYVSLPTPPASVAVNSPPAPLPKPPSSPSHDTPVVTTPTLGLSPTPPTAAHVPSESPMNASPEQTPSGVSEKPSEKLESAVETEQAKPAEPRAMTEPAPRSLPFSKTSKPVPRIAQGPATEPPIATGLSPLAVEEGPALQGISPACIVELEKLCEGVQAGAARRKCFKDNEEKLSPACQRQFDDMAARIKEDMQHFRTACAGDVKQFCPDVQPGGGSIVQCLEDNYKEVSENCYQTLKRFRKMKSGRSL